MVASHKEASRDRCRTTFEDAGSYMGVGRVTRKEFDEIFSSWWVFWGPPTVCIKLKGKAYEQMARTVFKEYYKHLGGMSVEELRRYAETLQAAGHEYFPTIQSILSVKRSEEGYSTDTTSTQNLPTEPPEITEMRKWLSSLPEQKRAHVVSKAERMAEEGMGPKGWEIVKELTVVRRAVVNYHIIKLMREEDEQQSGSDSRGADNRTMVRGAGDS